MPRKTTSLEAVATIGIDIGKNTFHLIDLDKMGAIVLRQKLSRSQIDARLANMPPCLSKGRDFGAWLGLVPRQMSTGGRTVLGPIGRLPPWPAR
jgi:hypothetical protein